MNARLNITFMKRTMRKFRKRCRRGFERAQNDFSRQKFQLTVARIDWELAHCGKFKHMSKLDVLFH